MPKKSPGVSNLPEPKTESKIELKAESGTNATSIEEQLSELDSAVEWFYGDDFSLDEALEQYQSAARLAEKIEADLENLKNTVQVIADFTKS